MQLSIASSSISCCQHYGRDHFSVLPMVVMTFLLCCGWQVLSIDIHEKDYWADAARDGGPPSPPSVTCKGLMQCLRGLARLQALRLCSSDVGFWDAAELPSLTHMTALTALHLATVGYTVDQNPRQLYPAGLRSLCLLTIPGGASGPKRAVALPRGFGLQLSALVALDVCISEWQAAASSGIGASGGTAPGSRFPASLRSLRLYQFHTVVSSRDAEGTTAAAAATPAQRQLLAALSALEQLENLNMIGAAWLAEVQERAKAPASAGLYWCDAPSCG